MYRIDDQMIVPVIRVNVCGNDYLKPIEIFRKLHAHLVYFLGTGGFSRFEALYKVFVEYAVVFPILDFRCHKFFESGFGYAVLTAD